MPARLPSDIGSFHARIHEDIDMHIRINRGHGVDGNLLLAAHVEAVVRKILHPMTEHLVRVEVHLDGENGGRTGIGDRSCTMEVRPRRHWPMVVSHRFGDVHQVVDGAARKMRSSLEHVFEHLEDARRRTDIGDERSPQAPAFAFRARPTPVSRATGHDASTIEPDLHRGFTRPPGLTTEVGCGRSNVRMTETSQQTPNCLPSQA